MKSTLLIGTTLLTLACGSGSQTRGADTSASPATAPPSANASSTAANSGQATSSVTLVGCLQGPALPGATGTAGSAAGDRARARATGNDAANAETHGGASTGRFLLVNATAESGGVGANGAGGSGGPLVNARSSFELDGLPADAQASVNKQVRITGHVDPRPVGAAEEATGAASGAAGTSASSGNSSSGVGSPSGMGTARAGGSAVQSGNATNRTPSTGGTNGVGGAPAGGGSASTRDDVRANSTTVASGDANPRRLTVETVQVVAQNCARKQ
jgi:hypothetical protein